MHLWMQMVMKYWYETFFFLLCVFYMYILCFLFALYILLQLLKDAHHLSFIQTSKSYHGRHRGPNISLLKQNYKNLNKVLKNPTKYSTLKACNNGYLAPLQLFYIFVHKMEWDKFIPKWTNLRMQQRKNNNNSKKVEKNFKYIDDIDLFVVLVVSLYLGFFKNASLVDVWNVDDGIKRIQKTISRQQFQIIRKSLTFYDPTKPKPITKYVQDNGFKVTLF